MPDLQSALNIDDLRRLACGRLPRGLFEFIDRGAEDEVTLRANRAALQRIQFRPRTLCDVAQRSQATTLFGRPIDMPLAVAPTGAVGLVWYDGEVAAAKAAARAGIPYTLSTASITPLERVADKAPGDLWFQLYVWPELSMMAQLIRRARVAGYRVLIVTVDAVVGSNREYNKRNKFTVPVRLNVRTVCDVARRPRWALAVMGRHLLAEGVPEFANLPEEFRTDLRGKGSTRLMPANAPVTRELLLRIRDMWDGPLLIKGVLHPADAELAAECGADGVVVSNHGGRTLDSAMAAIDALPAIVEVAGRRLVVLFDSGVRRGADVVKALALGARAVLAGRAPLWGTAVGGEAGANHALAILRQEIDRVMAQLGCPTLADIGPHCLAEERVS